MASPSLSDINTEQFDDVSKLKEIFKGQKERITRKVGRRFLMQFISPKNIVDMKVKSFAGLMKSCKYVNAVLTENRSTFVLHDFEVVIDYNNIEERKRLLENCQYHRFDMITFFDFENDVDELLAVVNSLNGRASAAQVHLINTLVIKEFFLYLRPTALTVKVRSLFQHFHCPIDTVTRDKIPGHLHRIDVDLDHSFTIELLENVISDFVGKSKIFKIRVPLKKISLDILYDRLEFCMKSLTIYRRNQRIYFPWVEYLIDDTNVTIMQVFRSKAEYSGLMYFSIQQAPYFYLFHKAKPGFVATKLLERANCGVPMISVKMEYCPTRGELRKFATDLYLNDDSECDDNTRRSLKDKIEDHFSSANVHDACYEPFENIEVQKFQLQPKQLEASELQRILDWKETNPLLQLSEKLPVKKQLELWRKAINFNETLISLLGEDKFFLKDIPLDCVLEIFKRMDTKAFVKALITCKEVEKAIHRVRPTFIKFVQQALIISRHDISDLDQWGATKLQYRNYFRFLEIGFIDFFDESKILQAVVSRLTDRHILCKGLKLDRTALLTQEMVKYLRPEYIKLNNGGQYCPQYYPEHMVKVYVEFKNAFDRNWGRSKFLGKHFDVEIKLLRHFSIADFPGLMQAIRRYISKIKSYRSNGRLVFNCTGTSYYARYIKRKEIWQEHDSFSYMKSTKYHQIFIFVAKVAEGVVASVFSDAVQKFLWQFITTMEDFEKLFADGTVEEDKNLGPEDEIAFSTIRSYFSQ